jgi:hypothetical protein
MSGDVQSILASAIAGVLGVLIGAVAQRSLELKRWKMSRKDEIRREIRNIAGDLTGGIAEFIHIMLWYTYFVPDKARPSDDLIRQYKDESHRLIGRMVGARVRLAALDVETHERIQPLIDEALSISERIDEDTGITDATTEISLEKIEELNEDARKLMDAVNDTSKALFVSHANGD